jgi:hypothetical protein
LEREVEEDTHGIDLMMMEKASMIHPNIYHFVNEQSMTRWKKGNKNQLYVTLLQSIPLPYTKITCFHHNTVDYDDDPHVEQNKMNN